MTDPGGWHGEIGYFDASGARTGRELFSLSRHGDGSRTLRAQCEMDDDDLVRDSLLMLAPDGKPSEAYVRIVEAGTPLGSGWYRFAGGEVEAHVLEPGCPPVLQSIRLPDEILFFGSHALANDAWLARLAETLPKGSSARLDNLVTCSLQANGGGVPAIHVTAARIEYVGDTEVEVAPGNLPCRHYRVGYGDYPPLDMWVTGPERILVRMTWGHLAGRYELLALSEDLRG